MIDDLPVRLRVIAESVDDWDVPLGARVDLLAAARELERLRGVVDDALAALLDESRDVFDCHDLAVRVLKYDC